MIDRNIQNSDYAEESAYVESLLIDFSSSDALAAIAQLQGVPEIIAKLDAAQKKFEILVLQQAEGEGV